MSYGDDDFDLLVDDLLTAGLIEEIGTHFYLVLQPFAGYEEGDRITTGGIWQVRYEVEEALAEADEETNEEEADEEDEKDTCDRCGEVEPKRCEEGHCLACAKQCCECDACLECEGNYSGHCDYHDNVLFYSWDDD